MPQFFSQMLRILKQRALETIDKQEKEVQWFVLNAESVSEVDITAHDMLKEFHTELAGRGIRFAMAEVKQDLYGQLRRSGLLAEIGENNIFPTITVAVRDFGKEEDLKNGSTTM